MKSKPSPDESTAVLYSAVDQVTSSADDENSKTENCIDCFVRRATSMHIVHFRRTAESAG
jgi:hypothetical protein